MTNDQTVRYRKAEEEEATMSLSLTPAAKEHFLAQLRQRPDCVGVRLSMKRAGCSGWLYQLDYVLEIPETDRRAEQGDGLCIFVDKRYGTQLQGTTIDYVTEGLNTKVVFDSPQAAGKCGCGESISFD